MAGAYDRVKLPVANLGALFNMRWALIKTPLVCNLAPPVAAAAIATLAIRLLTAQEQVQVQV